jgi:membrane fusion protein (multidrug efflux system)
MSTDIKPSKSSKRRITLPLIIAVALLASIWGFKHWDYARTHESTDNAQLDGDIIPILAKVGGYISTISVQENQLIKPGQILVTIDDQEYRVELAHAEAELAAAQALVGSSSTMGQAQAQLASASGQSQAVSARVLAARASHVRAQSDLVRLRELADKQIISRQQLDAAQAAADAAAAELLAAEKQAAAAGAQVSTAEAGVRIAQARLAAAIAARANANLKIAYTKIAAPASGFIARKQVEVGQLVSPGQPLMSIVSDSSVWITANFKETQLGKIRVGQPVEIEIDAYNGCKAEGVVESVSGATGAKFALLPPDNATGNFTKVVQRVPVRIAITKPCDGDQPLRPGLSAVVHVKTK